MRTLTRPATACIHAPALRPAAAPSVVAVERQGHTRSKLLIRSGSARRGSFAVPQVDPDDMREVSVEEDAYKNSDYFTDESTHEDFKKLRYTAIKTSAWRRWRELSPSGVDAILRLSGHPARLRPLQAPPGS